MQVVSTTCSGTISKEMIPLTGYEFQPLYGEGSASLALQFSSICSPAYREVSVTDNIELGYPVDGFNQFPYSCWCKAVSLTDHS